MRKDHAPQDARDFSLYLYPVPRSPMREPQLYHFDVLEKKTGEVIYTGYGLKSHAIGTASLLQRLRNS